MDAMTAGTETTARSSEEMRRLASVWIESMNRHDLSVWHALLADSYTASYPRGAGLDKGQAREFNQHFLDAFPDLHFEAHHTLIDGAFIAMHWTGSGTHTAPLSTGDGGTIPATGRSASVSGMLLTAIENGRIVREWTYWDRVSLFTQLGLMAGE
jgi:steroid delta-isomerase-like uncharacterized protein